MGHHSRDSSAPLAPPRRSGLHSVAVVGAYVAFFFVLHPQLLMGDLFLGWDAVNESWGDMAYGAHAWGAGGVPLWNPYEKAGFGFVADPAASATYPLSLPTYLAAWLFGYGPHLGLIRSLLHYAIAALGMHILLRRQRLGGAVPWLGTASYVLCARLAKNKDNAGMWTIAWFPWLVIAADEVVKKPSLRAGVALGVVMGLSILSGYPPDVFRNLLGLAPLVFLALWIVLKEERRGLRHLGRIGLALLPAVAIAVGLSLPVLLATAELVPHTARQAIAAGEAMHSVVRPAHALHLLSPRVLEPPFVYCLPYMGLLPVLLGAFALVARWSKERLLWAGCAAFFFLMACGGNFGLLPALGQVVPVFKMWRNPEVYLYLTAFFLALLAARGMGDALEAGEEGRRRRLVKGVIVASLVFGTTLVAWLVTRGGADRQEPKLQLSAALGVGLALAAGAVLVGLLALRSGRWRQVLAGGAVLFLLGDLGAQARPVYDILLPRPDLSRDAQLLALPGVKDQVRVADDVYFQYRPGARLEVRDLFGRYNTLVTERYKHYADRARQSYALLCHANVRYYAGRNFGAIAEQAGARGTRRGEVLELADAAPFAFWVGEAQLVDGGPEALDRLWRTPAGWRVAILERSNLNADELARVSRLRAPRPPVPARLERFGRNAVRLQAEAPAAGILVVNEAYFPGWEARVDGQPARVVRANHLFRGVLVGPGAHAVELRYRPARTLAGLWVYGATALGLVAVGIGSWVRRRRRAARSNAGASDAPPTITT